MRVTCAQWLLDTRKATSDGAQDSALGTPVPDTRKAVWVLQRNPFVGINNAVFQLPLYLT